MEPIRNNRDDVRYSGDAEKKSDRHLIGTAVLAILLGLALIATTRAARTSLRRIG